ncbi:MAG TPA: protein kinase [Verrucomicrobiota bacterium]|nr:hypothetical protein [Verrucomicrobiales bacterium]HRI14278.1 protein kinase [Verrucomicrobiota bacterium]
MDPNGDSEETIFTAALGLASPAARAAYLDQACAGNPDRRRAVEELLRAHEAARTFIDQSPLEEARRGHEIRALTPTAAPLPSSTEGSGSRIGRYKLLQQIGEGGCGTVFMAEQEEPVRRRVALKVIKLGMDTRSVVARFEAERQALALMDHPNIAKVLDAGATESGRPFFVMELVRGIPITRYCDDHKLDTQQRLDLFIKVCHAIQHAHQKGVIHRDIKPSNILVTLHDGQPVPKVIDFGIAKATEGRLTDHTLFTAFEQFIGTPAYMSPEQAEMSGLDIDTRSDIYALGVLLYELLTGKTPFDPKELAQAGLDEIRRRIREVEPARPSTRLSTLQGDALTTTANAHGTVAPKLVNLIRGDLDWIVMKCLEKDRTRRYETANGLAADILRHLQNEPVTARPPSQVYRFHKAYQRNRLAFTAAACVFVSLVIALAFMRVAARREGLARVHESIQRNLAEQRRVEAESAQKVAETEQQRADAQAQKALANEERSRRLLYASDMNLAQQALKLNNLGRARRLLDRHRPQTGQEDLRGWEWRYLWQHTRSSALETLTNRPTRGFSVSFSPDGSRLAVGWFDGRVDLWDVQNRRLIRALTDHRDHGFGRVAFSPVRNLLAATSETNVVTLYDLDSGRESVLWRDSDQGEWSVYNLSFSQDGSKLIIGTDKPFYPESKPDDSGEAVWVVNVASAQIESRHWTAEGRNSFFGGARLSPDNRRLYLPRPDVWNNRYSIQCLDLAAGRELWRTEPQRDYGLTALAVSPDGRVFASGSGYEDPTIRIWDAATGKLINSLTGHTGWVCNLEFTKDGRRLISAASDQTIRCWDTSTWRETGVLRGHTDEIHAVAISDTAHLIASAGKDGNLMLWQDDWASAPEKYRLLPENLKYGQVLPLDNSRVLLMPTGQPPELLDLKTGSLPVPLPEFGSSTDILGFFDTNLLCRWDGTNQILVGELLGTEFKPRGAITIDSGIRPAWGTYNAQRQLLAWTGEKNSTSIFLAALTSSARRIEIKNDCAVGWIVAQFSNDGNRLLVFTYTEKGCSFRVVNVDTGLTIRSIDEYPDVAAFANAGRVLVASFSTEAGGHGIGFYDLENPDRAPRRVAGRHLSKGFAVSPDGSLVALSNEGGQVRLFDPAKGELLESLDAHLNAALGLAFSADGQRLISSAGGREAVKLWDVVTRQELLTLGGTGSMLFAANWSADGNVILAGPPWQTWRAPSWEEIAVAEAKEKAEPKQP